MKKLNTILDQTTIVNFPFFYKLIKRYYITSIVVPLIVGLYSAFSYINQNTIFVKSIGFSIVKDQSSGASKTIASLMGEQVNYISYNDILLITKSHDFLVSISRKLIEHKDFNKFIFDSIMSKDIKTNAEIFGYCQKNITCIEKDIKGRIEGFFKIIENQVVDNYITIEVKTLDEETTNALTQAAQESLTELRIRSLTNVLGEQEKVIERLISEKNTSISNVNLEDIGKNIEIKKSDLSLLELKINDLEKELQKQKISLELSQSKLEQTKNVLKNEKVSSKDIDLVDKIKILSADILNLKRDIQAVELSQGELGSSDSAVLNQLKKNLSRKEDELNKAKSETRLTGADTEFFNRKDNFSNDLSFEYKVASSQVQKSVQRLKSLKEEKILKQKEIQDMEKRIEEFSPEFSQLKLLKNKLSQIVLLKSTISIDLIFDKEGSPTGRFKRTTKAKVLIYTFALVLFSLFSAIVLRYMLDSRIYDEYELKQNFQDLEIIGRTPKFK